MNTHTNTHTDDSCPLQSKGEVGQVRAQEVAVERESNTGWEAGKRLKIKWRKNSEMGEWKRVG